MLNIYKIELKNDEYDLEKIGTLDNNLKFKNEVNANFKLLDVPYEKNEIHSHLRDSAPDNWGRRVLNQIYGLDYETSEYVFLKLSNFDRVGNLFFSDIKQSENEIKDYLYKEDEIQKKSDLSTIENVMELENILNSSLNSKYNFNLQALKHGTSIGGARPKAVIEYEGERYLAKFSSTIDEHPLVKIESLSLQLAEKCGLNVSKSKIIHFNNKEILLVKRFDRKKENNRFQRFNLVSGLTVLELNEISAYYASYLDLVNKIDKKEEKIELYKRMAFNIIIGNTDDHARNHAFFWKNNELSLTPLYDVVSFPRNTFEASHGMFNGFDSNNKLSRLSLLSNVLHDETLVCFNLNKKEAVLIINQILNNVYQYLPELCENLKLDVNLFLGKSIANPVIFYGIENELNNPFNLKQKIDEEIKNRIIKSDFVFK